MPAAKPTAKKTTTRKTTKKPSKKKYKVKQKFNANIADRVIEAAVGEEVELNDFEYSIVKRFLEDE